MAKYIYTKLEETEKTKAFNKTMEKLNLLSKTMDICNGFDGDLFDELEKKQCTLIIQLTRYYNKKWNINTKYTADELKEEFKDGAILSEYMNQVNIGDIEDQLL